MGTALQAWIGVITALLAGVLGILKYFSYRTRRDRISLVGQAGLTPRMPVKRLAVHSLCPRIAYPITDRRATWQLP